jgi:hypothetical protein
MHEMRAFFQERWAELLIAGVWLQSVVSAIFTGNLTVMALTAFGGLALLALIFVVVERLRQSSRHPEWGGQGAFDINREAVVFTVGGQTETIEFALGHQKPEWVGMICSWQTDAKADGLKAKLGLDDDHVRKVVVNAFVAEDVREGLDSILRWLATKHVNTKDIAVDITGGTSIMSAGAYSRAAEQKIDCQYVQSNYDEKNQREEGSEHGVFVVRWVGTEVRKSPRHRELPSLATE